MRAAVFGDLILGISALSLEPCSISDGPRRAPRHRGRASHPGALRPSSTGLRATHRSRRPPPFSSLRSFFSCTFDHLCPRDVAQRRIRNIVFGSERPIVIEVHGAQIGRGANYQPLSQGACSVFIPVELTARGVRDQGFSQPRGRPVSWS